MSNEDGPKFRCRRNYATREFFGSKSEKNRFQIQHRTERYTPEIGHLCKYIENAYCLQTPVY